MVDSVFGCSRVEVDPNSGANKLSTKPEHLLHNDDVDKVTDKLTKTWLK